MTNYAGTVYFFPQTNTGGAGYQSQTYTHVLSTPEIYSNRKVADLNGDDKLDAIFDGASTSTTGDLVGLPNTGGGTFTSINLQTAATFYGADVADFNGDGPVDIASSYANHSSNSFPPAIEILNGSKTGAFTNSQPSPPGPPPTLAATSTSVHFFTQR